MIEPLVPCPICGNRLIYKKVSKTHGMDGSYVDWNISCPGCKLISMDYAADRFYGRKCYSEDEMIHSFNKKVVQNVQRRSDCTN